MVGFWASCPKVSLFGNTCALSPWIIKVQKYLNYQLLGNTGPPKSTHGHEEQMQDKKGTENDGGFLYPWLPFSIAYKVAERRGPSLPF